VESGRKNVSGAFAARVFDLGVVWGAGEADVPGRAGGAGGVTVFTLARDNVKVLVGRAERRGSHRNSEK